MNRDLDGGIAMVSPSEGLQQIELMDACDNAGVLQCVIKSELGGQLPPVCSNRTNALRDETMYYSPL